MFKHGQLVLFWKAFNDGTWRYCQPHSFQFCLEQIVNNLLKHEVMID